MDFDASTDAPAWAKPIATPRQMPSDVMFVAGGRASAKAQQAPPPARRPAGEVDLDALSLQELLDLRSQVEARLPPSNLKDINLEQELVLQVRALQVLQAQVLSDTSIAANQRAQVANALSAALVNLHKTQESIDMNERFRKSEAHLINAMQGEEDEALERILRRYQEAMEADGL